MVEGQESVQEETQLEEELGPSRPEIEERESEQQTLGEDSTVDLDVEEPAAATDEESQEPDSSEEEAEAQLEEDQEAPELEEERRDGQHWYVIHSYSGYENKVKKNLESRIESMGMQDYVFQVVVPTEEVVEIQDGRRRTVEQRIFPGYILVDMIMNDESWFVVRNTPGVTGFVGSGTEPTPLRQEEADKILKRMEEEAPKVKVSFRVGDAVRVVDGPFTDFLGTVDLLNLEKGKVRILVSFFGRETPVELDFLQVQTQ